MFGHSVAMPRLFPVRALRSLTTAGAPVLFGFALATSASAAAHQEALIGPAPVLRDTVGIFGRTGNYFRLYRSHGGVGGKQRRFHYLTENKPARSPSAVAGDFDQDGLDSIAVYEAPTNTFLYSNRNAYNSPVLAMQITGAAGVPVAGDWNGDGVDTFGLYQGDTGVFYLSDSLSSGPAASLFTIDDIDVPASPTTLTGGLPVSGDFDGDGFDSVGIYYPATQQFFLSNTAAVGAQATSFTFGPVPGLEEPLRPVMGDWNNNGVDTVGVLQQSAEQCHLRNANNSGPATFTVPVQTSTHVSWSAISGRWDLQGATGEGQGYAWNTLGPEAAGFDAVRLSQGFTAAAATGSMHSLLVFRGPNLVAEQYFQGMDEKIAINVKSVSKSFLSALVGIAIDRGEIGSLDDTVQSYLPSYTFSAGKENITLDDLMTMRSGLAWSESNIFGQFWGEPSWVQYVLGRSLSTTPGTTYKYSTGNTHVGAELIRQATGMDADDYADLHLWGPLGVSVKRWDRDPFGVTMGGAEVMMRPRDMARFGYLFLREGLVDGQQIVPSAWVQSSIEPVSLDTNGGDDYGHWWRHQVMADEDVYYAWGYGGQFVFFVPTLDLHVVATSNWSVNPSLAGPAATTVFGIMTNFIVPSAQP